MENILDFLNDSGIKTILLVAAIGIVLLIIIFTIIKAKRISGDINSDEQQWVSWKNKNDSQAWAAWQKDQDNQAWQAWQAEQDRQAQQAWDDQQNNNNNYY